MKKTVLTVAALFGLAAAAPAFAQGVDFDSLDVNGDDQISFEELQAALPSLTVEDFAILDVDGSGSLSREEFSILLQPPAQ